MRLFALSASKRTKACLITVASLAMLASAPMAAAPKGTGGTIRVVYEPGSDPAWEEFAQAQKAQMVFQELAPTIGEGIYLPNDIVTRFRNCGEANAFYDPALQEITMCYELIAAVQSSFSAAGDDPANIEADILGATLFFFFHELGHALVSELDIPVTGREEDAVDDLAAVIMLAADAEDDGTAEDEGLGAMMLAAAVMQFGEMASKPESFENIAFWDEHSLDAQRMYHLICLIYGSNPAIYAELAGDDVLPKARAARCPAEYQQRQRNWERLLEAHFKPEA